MNCEPVQRSTSGICFEIDNKKNTYVIIIKVVLLHQECGEPVIQVMVLFICLLLVWNWHRYTTGESLSEVLGYQYRLYNTTDSFPKYDTSSQVSTGPHLLRRIQLIYDMKKMVYYLRSRGTNN